MASPEKAASLSYLIVSENSVVVVGIALTKTLNDNCPAATVLARDLKQAEESPRKLLGGRNGMVFASLIAVAAAAAAHLRRLRARAKKTRTTQKPRRKKKRET